MLKSLFLVHILLLVLSSSCSWFWLLFWSNFYLAYYSHVIGLLVKISSDYFGFNTFIIWTFGFHSSYVLELEVPDFDLNFWINLRYFFDILLKFSTFIKLSRIMLSLLSFFGIWRTLDVSDFNFIFWNKLHICP